MSDFRVTLRPLPERTPAEVRLRRFLKAALRAYELRAVEVVEVRGEAVAGDRPADDQDRSTRRPGPPGEAVARREGTVARTEEADP
jgi:hypothetical protein